MWRQQLRPAERFPPHTGRASLQAEDLSRQAAPSMCAETVLALSAGPRLLLVRRRRLVYRVNVERVAEVGVRVAGLRVGDGLVGRREVRGLEVRIGRVRERGRRAVQVLTDRWQVRQPGISIAVAVVPFLRDGRDREAVRDDSKGGRKWGHLSPAKEKKVSGNVQCRYNREDY